MGRQRHAARRSNLSTDAGRPRETKPLLEIDGLPDPTAHRFATTRSFGVSPTSDPEGPLFKLLVTALLSPKHLCRIARVAVLRLAVALSYHATLNPQEVDP